ncbi:hypothetical protein BGZ50_004305 [Haplosporangium sp. Z 11]|nr:hypothetical protein BGZ50_004305 [Haplosporangium sp. Z 11]
MAQRDRQGDTLIIADRRTLIGMIITNNLIVKAHAYKLTQWKPFRDKRSISIYHRARYLLRRLPTKAGAEAMFGLKDVMTAVLDLGIKKSNRSHYPCLDPIGPTSAKFSARD